MGEQVAKNRKMVGWVLGTAAALVVVGGGTAFWWEFSSSERTDDAQLEGTVVPINARVGGFAQSVRVRDDQIVHAGDTMFTIDPTEYVLRVRQAEAELWAARAAAQNGVAGAGASAAKAQKAVAQNNIEVARSNLDKANRDLDRTKLLRQRDVASQSQLDAAEAAATSAAAAYRAATEQAAVSGFGETGAQAQVRLTEAKIAAAQAAVDVARTQLSWTASIAPVTGRIAKKSLEVGQYVSPGQPVLAVVSDSAVWVVANLKETQIDEVHAGLPVHVSVDAYPGLSLTGKVRSLQAATGSRFSMLPPDNASGNFTKVVQRVPVRIDLDIPDSLRSRLVPGLSTNIAIRVRN